MQKAEKDEEQQKNREVFRSWRAETEGEEDATGWKPSVGSAEANQLTQSKKSCCHKSSPSLFPFIVRRQKNEQTISPSLLSSKPQITSLLFIQPPLFFFAPTVSLSLSFHPSLFLSSPSWGLHKAKLGCRIRVSKHNPAPHLPTYQSRTPPINCTKLWRGFVSLLRHVCISPAAKHEDIVFYE